MITKALCESNRIQAIGTWNNHFCFGNYFIVSTDGEVNHILIKIARLQNYLFQIYRVKVQDWTLRDCQLLFTKANFDDTALPYAWFPSLKCILADNIPAGL